MIRTQDVSAPSSAGFDGLRLRRSGVAVTGETVAFTFDGRLVLALKGETVVAALAANGIRSLRQTGEAETDIDNRWRGQYCGMGTCFDCVVTIDGRAGQRSCLAKVAGGEIIRSVAPAGTAEDPLRPLAAFPAGPALSCRESDILVVGAGPAGLRAALAARRAGAEVIVLDERRQPGGQYFKPVAPSHTPTRPYDRQFADGEALAGAVVEVGVTLVQPASVWGAFSPGEVVALVGDEAVIFRTKRLILATGAYERPMPIPGWTLPGVMTTGAAQTLTRAYQVAPGRKVVIAGNGPLNLQLAADLVACGVEVVAVAESAPRPGLKLLAVLGRALRADPAAMLKGAGYLARLKRAGVPLLWGHLAVAATGTDRLAAVDLAPVDAGGEVARGNPAGTLEADTLCLGYGFIASSEIAAALGCRLEVDQRHICSLRVVSDENGETSVAGVFCVGDGAHVAGAAVAEAAGEIAGARAAAQIGFQDSGSPSRIAAAVEKRARARRFQADLWALFQAPPVRLESIPDKTPLCRCEAVSFGAIRAEIAKGSASLAVLKRRTRLGMGRCQGRYCALVAADLLRSMRTRATSSPSALPRGCRSSRSRRQPWRSRNRNGAGHRRAGSPDLSRPLASRAVRPTAAEIASHWRRRGRRLSLPMTWRRRAGRRWSLSGMTSICRPRAPMPAACMCSFCRLISAPRRRPGAGRRPTPAARAMGRFPLAGAC